MKTRFYYLAILFLATGLLAGTQSSQGQQEYKIRAGYNIGGSSPLPLPVEIRKIRKFSPMAFAPHIALEATQWIEPQWGISAGLAIDYKGFTVENEVKNLRTEIEMGDDTYIGNFTGKNKTQVQNAYLTIPILFNWRINERWNTQAGIYGAYLFHADFKGTASDGYIRQGSPVGEKTIVTEASFDFSGEQNRFDYGLLVAGEWSFHPGFALRGQIAWGLRSLFPGNFTGVSFNMYNIYGSLGVSYTLKTK